MKTLLRLAAIICNAIEWLTLRMIPVNIREELEETENEMKVSYYFMVSALRYNRKGISTQTRAVEITIDSDKYTRIDAESFAAREFVHLDDSWIIRVTPMTYENYLITKRKFELSIEQVKGPAEPYTKTNS